MKTVNRIKEKKRKSTMKPNIKSKKEKVLMVAQEIKFARLLSGNEKKTRDRVLKSFQKWLLGCFHRGHEFKEDDFLRIWKGLFYAVWMSDKPLVQEDLCETIAGILDLFPADKLGYALMMTKAGFKVLATDWYGIDQHRMDKFLMLVRRYLRGSLRCLQRGGWRVEDCTLYANMLGSNDGVLSPKTPMYARNAGSMLLHFVDCFLEELSKVSAGDIPDASIVELLRPFCTYMVKGESLPLCVANRRLLSALLRQTPHGQAYQDKTKAWERMGCPVGGPDALELVSDDDDQGQDDDEESPSAGPLDPRAGRVDVVLSPVPVPALGIADMLRGLLSGASSKAHKRTKICLQRFEELSKDRYPLCISEDIVEEVVRPDANVAASNLRALEKKLVAASDELALRGLSRKHRKRLLAKSRAGVSIVGDVPKENITSTNGDWAVQSEEPKPLEKKTTKQTNKDISNKENLHKDKHAKKRKNLEQINNKKPKNDKKESTKSDKAKVELKVEKQENKTQEIIKLKPKQLDNKVNINKNDKTQEFKVKAKVGQNVDSQQKVQKCDKLKENSKKILKGRIEKSVKSNLDTPKKVKFVLKNNSMQGTVDYYKSVRQSPSIPFDSSKKPTKTNLKVSTPSPINPFFRKKLRLK